MSLLLPFRLDNDSIRVHVDDEGIPWWVARDICDCLEILDVSDAVEMVDDDEKAKVLIPTPGGPQFMWCVNEQGLYHLIGNLGQRLLSAGSGMTCYPH